MENKSWLEEEVSEEEELLPDFYHNDGTENGTPSKGKQ
jgi:hypothetical protein